MSMRFVRHATRLNFPRRPLVSWSAPLVNVASSDRTAGAAWGRAVMPPTLLTSHPPFSTASPREKPADFPATYRLQDLGELAPGVPLLPVALNDAGQLALYGHAPERQAKLSCVRGYLWHEGARTESGSVFGGVPLTSLSGNGLLAGQQRVGAAPFHAWASHREGFGAELWPEAESCASGVNTVGEVAGHVTFVTNGRARRRVFLYDGGAPRLLPVSSGANSVAMALNDSGTVLANVACGLFETQSQVALWWGEAVTMIKPEPGGGIWGTALTPGGRVCGRMMTAQGNIRAFLHEGGRTYDLNASSTFQSEALGANDARVVVGRFMDDSGRREAFRWTPADGFRALGELVRGAPDWILQKAVAVNAAGWIAGTGLRDGALRGFLLMPVST